MKSAAFAGVAAGTLPRVGVSNQTLPELDWAQPRFPRMPRPQAPCWQKYLSA